MNTTPRFKIGDRVKLRYGYDEATDSPYPTDDGDEGVIYGVAWNNGDRWYREGVWVYFIRLDRHRQPWLPCPFWDPDPMPEDELVPKVPKSTQKYPKVPKCTLVVLSATASR